MEFLGEARLALVETVEEHALAESLLAEVLRHAVPRALAFRRHERRDQSGDLALELVLLVSHVPHERKPCSGPENTVDLGNGLVEAKPVERLARSRGVDGIVR